MKPIYKFIIGDVTFTFLKKDGKWYIHDKINKDNLYQDHPEHNNEYFKWAEIVTHKDIVYTEKIARYPLKEGINLEDWVEAYNEEIYFCKSKLSEIEKQSYHEAMQIMRPNNFTEERNSIIRCSCPLCDETRGRWYLITDKGILNDIPEVPFQ